MVKKKRQPWKEFSCYAAALQNRHPGSTLSKRVKRNNQLLLCEAYIIKKGQKKQLTFAMRSAQPLSATYLMKSGITKCCQTSDAGSQYRCTRFTISLRTGRQGHPTQIHTPTPTRHKNIHKKYPNAHFCLDHYGWTDVTDQRADKASYSVACPQLKMSLTMRL